MKRIALKTGFAALGIFFITSCAKNFTCVCNEEGLTNTIAIEKETKKSAQTICDSFAKGYDDGCTLH